MKKTLVSLLLLAACALPMNAIPVVSISGTIFTEHELEEGRFRVKSTSLNAQAIYQAYGVSGADYLLDCDPGGTNFLVLRPRPQADQNLPTIVILQNLGSPHYLRDWSGRPPRHEMPVTGPASAVPLFNAFRGTALGRVDFSTPSAGPFRAHYEVMGSSSTHILKFKFRIERSGRPFP